MEIKGKTTALLLIDVHSNNQKIKRKKNNNQHVEGRDDFVFPASTGESNVMQINNTILYHKYGHIWITTVSQKAQVLEPVYFFGI